MQHSLDDLFTYLAALNIKLGYYDSIQTSSTHMQTYTNIILNILYALDKLNPTVFSMCGLSSP